MSISPPFTQRELTTVEKHQRDLRNYRYAKEARAILNHYFGLPWYNYYHPNAYIPQYLGRISRYTSVIDSRFDRMLKVQLMFYNKSWWDRIVCFVWAFGGTRLWHWINYDPSWYRDPDD